MKTTAHILQFKLVAELTLKTFTLIQDDTISWIKIEKICKLLILGCQLF
jgi:hypothetical protein